MRERFGQNARRIDDRSDDKPQNEHGKHALQAESLALRLAVPRRKKRENKAYGHDAERA